MPITRLAWLFKKYFDKTATPEEVAEFMQLADKEEHAAELQALMEQTWTRFDSPAPFFSETESRSMLQAVLEEASAQEPALQPVAAPPAPVHPLRRMPWGWIAAASLLIIALGGMTFWWGHKHRGAPAIARTITPLTKPADILPGGNKAVLILDNGASIALDSSRTGVLATQGTTRVLQLGGGRLAYHDAPLTKGTGGTPVLFNTVRTPTGGQYQVTLPDNSKVWLNAASSLRFPTAFTGKDRTVELTGEAYFEIESNKDQPFYVKVNDMTVDVLGTHFNIMAYGDEGSINTSLLQGSVKIEKGQDARILKPGQQVRLSRETGALLVEAADTEQVVAWKNGLFQFEGATLETVMRQLERWYDVDVRYEGTFSRHFSGLIPRSATLTEVLHMLDLAGGKARFSLEGRTVVVKPI